VLKRAARCHVGVCIGSEEELSAFDVVVKARQPQWDNAIAAMVLVRVRTVLQKDLHALSFIVDYSQMQRQIIVIILGHGDVSICCHCTSHQQLAKTSGPTAFDSVVHRRRGSRRGHVKVATTPPRACVRHWITPDEINPC